MKSVEEILGVCPQNAKMVASHNFISQDIFLIDQEPLAFCTAQDKLLVATYQHNIEIRDLDLKGQPLISFPTVDQVIHMEYCEIGNYIVTLEKKAPHYSSSSSYVRVYLNWWIDIQNQPMKVRIAGCVTPGNEVASGHLEMVELPVVEQATCVGCCKKAGTLAVGTNKGIKVFRLQMKVHEKTKQKFQDFEHLMDFQVGFLVRKVYVCEDFFSCLSDNEVHVFQVTFDTEADSNVPQKDSKSQASSSSHSISKKKGNSAEEECSEIIDDEYFIEWKFDEFAKGTLDLHDKLRDVLHPSSFPLTISLKSVETITSQEKVMPEQPVILGPRAAISGCMIEVKLGQKLEQWHGLLFNKVSVVTFLYRRFESQEDGDKISFLEFHWLPYYVAEEATGNSVLDPLTVAAAWENSSSSSPLHSAMHGQLKLVSCLLSTQKEAYLYDITKVTEELCKYTYTAPARSVSVEPCFLHALTENALETYAVKTTHRVVNYASVGHGKDYCCSSDFVCLLGLRPFLGLDKLVMSDHHLVLVSTYDDTSSSTDSNENPGTTFYSLLKPTPQQLFSDLADASGIYKTSDPATYLQLLREGNMILRTRILLHGEKQCDSDLIRTYQESCSLIADILLRTDAEREREKSVQFYCLSKQPVEQVITRILSLKSQVKNGTLMKVLVNYLKTTLCHYQHKADVQNIPQSTADLILDVFAEEAPDYLFRIILLSGINTFKTEKAVHLLKKKLSNKKPSTGYAADTLAISYLLLQAKNTETAQNVLLSLSKENFVPVLCELHRLIHSDEGLSSLGQHIKSTRPDAYFSSLLHLKNSGVLSPDDIVKNLKMSSPGSEPHSVPLLKEFLEAVVTSKRFNPQSSSHLLVMLINIYLGRLEKGLDRKSNKHLPGVSSHVKPSSFFGGRPSWIRELPPLNGNNVTRSCNVNSSNDDAKCICWSCLDDLLRLQSLLNSDLVSSAVHFEVKEILQTVSPEITGYLSLQVSCLPCEEAIQVLLEKCPTAVLFYVQDKFQDNSEKWIELFHSVNCKVSEMSATSSDYPTYKRLLHGILTYLSDTLVPVNLVELLPSGDDAYLLYVKHCCEKHQARLLREKIVALGVELKSMM